MLITFLLLSQFIFFMLWAHFNLKSVALESINNNKIFAHTRTRVDFRISNNSHLPQEDLSVESTSEELELRQESQVTVASQSQDYAIAMMCFSRRGKIEMTKWQLSSIYPLGLFKTWKYYHIYHCFMVYPQLKGLSLSEYFMQSKKDESANFDFEKHINYELSPKANQIDWKIFAKTDQLLVRKYTNDDMENLHFEFAPIGYEIESYISQFALWIYDAQHMNYEWSFSCANFSTEMGLGQEKFDRVMEYLACY
jgi:uncharacterized protein (DUF58 family)